MNTKKPYFFPVVLILLIFSGLIHQEQPLSSLLPEDDRELLLRAQSLLRSGDFAGCITVLSATRRQNSFWHLLYGQAAMGQREYTVAADHLLLAEEHYPQTCAKALETCYRELEDYKKAYHYACKQRQ